MPLLISGIVHVPQVVGPICPAGEKNTVPWQMPLWHWNPSLQAAPLGIVPLNLHSAGRPSGSSHGDTSSADAQASSAAGVTPLPGKAY
jgi:hypothetical protein